MQQGLGITAISPDKYPNPMLHCCLCIASFCCSPLPSAACSVGEPDALGMAYNIVHNCGCAFHNKLVLCYHANYQHNAANIKHYKVQLAIEMVEFIFLITKS